MDVCRESFPEPVPTAAGGTVWCHLHTSGPMLGGRPVSELAAQPDGSDSAQAQASAVDG